MVANEEPAHPAHPEGYVIARESMIPAGPWLRRARRRSGPRPGQPPKRPSSILRTQGWKRG